MLVNEMTATKRMNLGVSLKVNETKYPNTTQVQRRSSIEYHRYYLLFPLDGQLCDCDFIK